jgi:hypothetical protein
MFKPCKEEIVHPAATVSEVLDCTIHWGRNWPQLRQYFTELVILVKGSSVEATDHNITTFDFFPCSLDSLKRFHQLANRRLGPLFILNVLPSVVEEVELFEEVDMGDMLPTD